MVVRLTMSCPTLVSVPNTSDILRRHLKILARTWVPLYIPPEKLRVRRLKGRRTQHNTQSHWHNSGFGQVKPVHRHTVNHRLGVAYTSPRTPLLIISVGLNYIANILSHYLFTFHSPFSRGVVLLFVVLVFWLGQFGQASQLIVYPPVAGPIDPRIPRIPASKLIRTQRIVRMSVYTHRSDITSGCLWCPVLEKCYLPRIACSETCCVCVFTWDVSNGGDCCAVYQFHLLLETSWVIRCQM